MAKERIRFIDDGKVAVVLHERGLHPSRGMGYIVRNEVRPATPEEIAEHASPQPSADHLGSLVTHTEVEHVMTPDMLPPASTPDTSA